MEINGKLIRELWLVKFRSSHMIKQGNVLERQDIDVQSRVWAHDAEEAIAYVKRNPPPSQSGPLPWLGLLGVENLGLLEAHILNQPKREEEVQPSKVSGSGGEELTPIPVPAPSRFVLLDSSGSAIGSKSDL